MLVLVCFRLERWFALGFVVWCGAGDFVVLVCCGFCGWLTGSFGGAGELCFDDFLGFGGLLSFGFSGF